MKDPVNKWMTHGVVHAAPTEPLYRAIELMAERGLRHVVVLEGDQLRGIVSSRDIVRAPMRHPERKLDLHGCTMAEVMTPCPLQTTTTQATIGEAARIMHDHKIGALPVVERGRVVGILTIHDVLAAVSHEARRASGRYAAVPSAADVTRGER